MAEQKDNFFSTIDCNEFSFFPPRNLTLTKIQSQSLWSACMWTLTSIVPRRSSGSVNQWVTSHFASFWKHFENNTYELLYRYIFVRNIKLVIVWSSFRSLFTLFVSTILIVCALHIAFLEHSETVLWDFTVACNWPIRQEDNSESFISQSLHRGVQIFLLRGKICQCSAN